MVIYETKNEVIYVTPNYFLDNILTLYPYSSDSIGIEFFEMASTNASPFTLSYYKKCIFDGKALTCAPISVEDAKELVSLLEKYCLKLKLDTAKTHYYSNLEVHSLFGDTVCIEIKPKPEEHITPQDVDFLISDLLSIELYKEDVEKFIFDLKAVIKEIEENNNE